MGTARMRMSQCVSDDRRTYNKAPILPNAKKAAFTNVAFPIHLVCLQSTLVATFAVATCSFVVSAAAHHKVSEPLEGHPTEGLGHDISHV